MRRGDLVEVLNVGGQELTEGIARLDDGFGEESLTVVIGRDVDCKVCSLFTAFHGIPPMSYGLIF